MATLIQANLQSSSSEKAQKARQRASVACAACRERRTRCAILPGQNECTQCRATNSECVIKYDDERRKPNSRAYINSLNDRIASLENALKEKERQVTGLPSAPATASSTTSSQRNGSQSPIILSKPLQTTNEQSQLQSRFTETTEIITDSDATDGYSPPSTLSASGNESMVSKLLSTTGHLSFDQLSGRLRYFGPTTNCHVHSDLHHQSEQVHKQALEQQRRTQRIINNLSQETHDYLMNSFWQHYNSVIHVIHQAAFEDGYKNGGGQFYSGFLHICILAMGYRPADKKRPDMIKISMPNRESILHREAKFMLDYEMEQPGGIPSIQALLLLGDLECGVGRDNLGWLYSGIANRLCFDIGLHLDRSNTGLSQREIDIGRMTLLACIIYDKYWALFLGRPTSLKSSDLEIYNLSQQFERLGSCQPAGPEKTLETLIYESLLDLMEIAGKITEIMDQASKLNDSINVNHHVFIRMANLNRELEIWYTRLPKALQWTPENVETAPFSFFLLHQQYHVTLILLHRPFAKYGDDQTKLSEESVIDEDYAAQPNFHLSSMSRTICTQHAVRVARIFWQHRQRFDTKEIFVTGLQHAGTAAIALVAALASLKDVSSRDANMHYLECLAAALQDMAETYHPAERMSSVLQGVILELRATLPQRKVQKVVPARRQSSNDDGPEQFMPAKRHQSFRETPQRSMSSNSIPKPKLGQPEPNKSGNMNDLSASNSLDQEMQAPKVRNRGSAEGFVMVTSRTDNNSYDDTWPSIDKPEPSSLDYSLFSGGSNRPTFVPKQPQLESAWMGAETPAVSPPPTANFVFQSPSLYRSSVDRLQDEAFGNNPSNLDFLTLLSSDRSDFPPLGVSNDDFALLPTPTATPVTAFTGIPLTGMNNSTERRYTTGQLRHQDGSAAQTMAGLDDLWNQMVRSDKKR